jgi:hypothetical protein
MAIYGHLNTGFGIRGLYHLKAVDLKQASNELAVLRIVLDNEDGGASS